MKCHYEVLGVPKDSSPDDIKKAYRKLALQWHPDKNPDRIEECTNYFMIIQQAFDVLSDPHERAWYDKHRDAIIKGGVGENYMDNSLDIYQYFNVSCYSGFGDDSKSFYAVYSKVFETIAAEDLSFMDDKDSDLEIPGFGHSDSSYEEIVHPFYAYWQSYCTAKSFVWVEKYDIREAPHRRVLRLMEKENKKLRDTAKKEYNEEVRELVAFVRKRDKRVQAYRKKLEEKAIAMAHQVEIRKEQQRLDRLKLMENYKEAQWSSMAEVEKQLQDVEASMDREFGQESVEDEGEGEDEEEGEDLYCVACDKAFKSTKSLDNHTRSKKHKENVDLLRSVMQEEENVFQNGQDSLETNNLSKVPEISDSEEDTLLQEATKTKLSKKQKKKRRQLQNQNLEDLPHKKTNDDNVEKHPEIPVQLEHKEDAPNLDSVPILAEEKSQNLSIKLKDKKVREAKKALKIINTEVSQENVKDMTCSSCKMEFNTRNKLFEHLKTSGHAVVLSGKATNNEQTKKGKRKTR